MKYLEREKAELMSSQEAFDRGTRDDLAEKVFVSMCSNQAGSTQGSEELAERAFVLAEAFIERAKK